MAEDLQSRDDVTALAPMQAPHHNNFDLIRLLAATQVMLLHASSHLNVDLGMLRDILQVFPGVPIFFVVSGLLVSASHERTQDLRRYSWNRFLRIYPALWACLVLSILSAWVTARVDFLIPEAAPWFLAQATIAQFYNPGFLRGYGVGVLNGSLWTLSVELQFYIVLPLLLTVLGRTSKRSDQLLLLVFAGTLLANLTFTAIRDSFSWGLIRFAGVTMLPYAFYFMIGVAAHRHLEAIKPLVVGKLHLWLVAYAATAFLTQKIGWHAGGDLINPVSAVVLAFLTLSIAFTFPALSSRVLRGNDISYGVYIYHVPVLNVLVHERVTGTYASLFAAVVVSYVLGALSWALLERHCLAAKPWVINLKCDSRAP